MSNIDYLDTPRAQRIAARLTEEDLTDLAARLKTLRDAGKATDEGNRKNLSRQEMRPLHSAEQDAFDDFFVACECLEVSGRFVIDLLDRNAN